MPDQSPSFLSAAAPTWASLAGKCVLIVDDDATNREILEQFVQRRQCLVRSVSDGWQAVQMFAAEQLDLILMDLQMPIMSGLEACLAIRGSQHEGAQVPIIAITADAQLTTLTECRAAGMNEFLTKPVHRNQLYRVLDDYLLEGRNYE